MTNPTETTRKLMAMGGSAVISVPPPYLKGHNLDVGDDVRVLFDGDILVIRPINPQEKAKK